MAGESVYDHPFQWGSKRTGPDLARVGGRYSDEWHQDHFQNAKSVVPESVMPPYGFLADTIIDGKYIQDTVATNRMAGVLWVVLVQIPLGTVVLEEVAFRSVLWGMLARHGRPWQVLATTSALFGLWHVFPAMASATGNPAIGSAVAGLGPLAKVAVVGGTVLFTALGGVLAGELRRRSGSLFASVGMHWATNSLGVLFGVLAWRLTS